MGATMRLVKLTRLPPDKDQQVDITVDEMVRITRMEAWSPELRWLLHQIRRPDYSPLQRAVAATEFIREHFPFELDPEEIELIRLPSYYARAWKHRQRPGGDCDDLSLLLGTLLYSMGVEVAYVVISRSPTNPEFGHVFVAAKFAGAYRFFDPSVSRPYKTEGLRIKWYRVPVAYGPPAV